jgi:hypothetical protein
VSHLPERKERDCLNCGTIVNGKFCHICGQQNIQIKQSFISLTRHFIYDIFHFDGKFFDTLKYLFTRPGYIPKEYIKGRRQSYLDPIRMYLFTSAIFFIIFFTLNDPRSAFQDVGDQKLSRNERFIMASEVFSGSAGKMDSISEKKMRLLLDTSVSVYLMKHQGTADSALLVNRNNQLYRLQARKVDTVAFKNSSKWLSRMFSDRYAQYQKRYGDDSKAFFGDFSDTFMHKLPYVLFVSLPVFALILKLLYLRRKEYLYADHVVFTLYHFILSFILLLLFFSIDQLEASLDWGFLNYLGAVIIISIAVFLFRGMKRFYGQGKGKTFIKFALLNLLGLISLLVIMILFIVLSFIQL